MKKIMTISLLFMLAAFWTYPCQAGNVVYFAPDGSQITKAEYDRLVSEKANSNTESKKIARPKVSKKPNRLASLSGSKTAAVKAKRTQPRKSTALKAGNISQISQSDIRKITRDLLQLTNQRDPKGLIAYLAPSYKVSLKTYEIDHQQRSSGGGVVSEVAWRLASKPKAAIKGRSIRQAGYSSKLST